MPRLRDFLLLTAPVLLLAAPASLGAQDRPVPQRDTVPPVPREMLPPPGKCRIWIADVPPKQQPAPMECAAALRQNPANGMVLYGPALKDQESDRFEFSFRSQASPLDGPVRRASLTERRDSIGSSKRATSPPDAPAARDSAAAKGTPTKKPAEPVKKKPERP